jgi:phytoene synthase
MNRSELVTAAGETIYSGSKSFRLASLLFDRKTRERAWLLYCWCRHCDDQCDGQVLGHGRGNGAESVGEIAEATSRVLEGERSGRLPFDALAQVLAECPIPPSLLYDHLKGFALDAQGWRPKDEEDLILYCYYVAGTVGRMMALVMGVSPDDEETLRRASELGIAFQLSNIARDVRDDHEAGRCYLPMRWMETHGVHPRDPLRPDRREALVALVRRLCDLSERYEASAREGIKALPFRSRWAVHAAATIYGRIGRSVAERGGAAWDRRVVVPRRQKAAFVLKALGSAI